MNIFNLPDLGEGLPDAEIVKWFVKEGDTVKVDAPLVAMETAKAVVDVPSPVAGTIKKLYGKPGDIIITGAPLVEYVNSDVQVTGRDTGTVVGAIEVGDTVISQTATNISTSTSTHTDAKATPAVRALAQRLQVDLAHVIPTGPNNTITSKDIEQAAEHLSTAGDLELLKGARRNMAQNMEKSHQEIVLVTISEDAILYKFQEQDDITVKIIQALTAACKKEPSLNAWYDGKAMGRRLIKQLDLGIAVDTADGLYVPVIRDAGNKDASTLRIEINSLREQVQQHTIKPETMRGFSFILSNFGKFAGRYSSPIVVPPSVAILGVGKIRDEVVPVNGIPAIAKVLPLSLSFDHRACTGGEASRFLGAVIAKLED
jgi:2-oxoisovalerate dehydrogenase E2 component (dihydrolipoyl transacylase)